METYVPPSLRSGGVSVQQVSVVFEDQLSTTRLGDAGVTTNGYGVAGRTNVLPAAGGT